MSSNRLTILFYDSINCAQIDHIQVNTVATTLYITFDFRPTSLNLIFETYLQLLHPYINRIACNTMASILIDEATKYAYVEAYANTAHKAAWEAMVRKQ